MQYFRLTVENRNQISQSAQFPGGYGVSSHSYQYTAQIMQISQKYFTLIPRDALRASAR